MARTVDERAELLRRWQAGEREAFDALADDLRPAAERFLRRLAGELDDAEALVQEAFLALWLARDRLRGPADLLPFLFRVLRNQGYSELRRRGAFERRMGHPTELDELAGALSNGEPEPDEQLVRMLALAELERAIDSLPEAQREALILYAQAELSYPQIAAATGADLGTVKSRLHHARRNLRLRLRPEVLDALGLPAGGDEPATTQPVPASLDSD